MWKFPEGKAAVLAAAIVLSSGTAASAQDDAGDAAAGEAVFRACAACHAVGEGATNRVGPQLNALFGRTAGGADDYAYSDALVEAGEGGMVWNHETLSTYIADPRGTVPGTKMAFGGIKDDQDMADLLAYLAGFSEGDAAPDDAEASADDEPESGDAAAEAAPAVETESNAAVPVDQRPGPGDHGNFGIGRPASEEEIAAWDIDVRPDGKGLPVGSGTVLDGEQVYFDQCATCHGDFGEGLGRWPVLAGGMGTLEDDRPEKTVGSFWPHVSTVYDYVRRTMPFGNARSLSDDEVYAVTAYVLYLNDIVRDEEFELSNENLADIELPNAGNFIADDRFEEDHYAEKDPCMSDCLDAPAEITMRAQVLDVTPDSGDEGSGGGAID
ncbi:c-type cytochrome [Pararhizobium haloflavum]|uniref:c-type cytochrome n=1 Tax=Pararhizobium haloflavum TaxID=2037914 RepID=UPI0018E434A1|nr:c-type cytochrome [Pararhizobium haloflavum]